MTIAKQTAIAAVFLTAATGNLTASASELETCKLRGALPPAHHAQLILSASDDGSLSILISVAFVTPPEETTAINTEFKDDATIGIAATFLFSFPFDEDGNLQNTDQPLARLMGTYIDIGEVEWSRSDGPQMPLLESFMKLHDVTDIELPEPVYKDWGHLAYEIKSYSGQAPVRKMLRTFNGVEPGSIGEGQSYKLITVDVTETIVYRRVTGEIDPSGYEGVLAQALTNAPRLWTQYQNGECAPAGLFLA